MLIIPDVFQILTAPGRGEGVMPLYRTHLVWDCSTVAFCMYLPLEKTSSTAVMLYAHTADNPTLPLVDEEHDVSHNRIRKVRRKWVSVERRKHNFQVPLQYYGIKIFTDHWEVKTP